MSSHEWCHSSLVVVAVVVAVVVVAVVVAVVVVEAWTCRDARNVQQLVLGGIFAPICGQCRSA